MKDKFRTILSILVLFTIIILLVNCGNDPVKIEDDFVDHTGEVGTVTDIEGNSYATIGIGGQIWMAENLKTNRYRNGDAIPQISDNSTWQSLTFGASCSFNNDPGNSAVYGLMYNWQAVTDTRGLAPEGWHVPSHDEWRTLLAWLDGSQIAGSKLKESGNTHWSAPNFDATNESGFTALPGGWRLNLGNYLDLGTRGYWWTRSNDYLGGGFAYSHVMFNDSTKVTSYATITNFGLSVRCVKDE